MVVVVSLRRWIIITTLIMVAVIIMVVVKARDLVPRLHRTLLLMGSKPNLILGATKAGISNLLSLVEVNTLTTHMGNLPHQFSGLNTTTLTRRATGMTDPNSLFKAPLSRDTTDPNSLFKAPPSGSFLMLTPTHSH